MESNSDQEVSNLSPEDKLAAAFEKAGIGGPEKDTRAEQEELEEVTEQSADAEETEEESGAEEAEPEESADSEAVEVEYEGKAYKLPKELKDALLRQSDYTRKTQETAAQRRAVEERAQTLELQSKFQAEHFQKAVEAQALQSQLQQFSQVNWAELAESNPSQYLQLDRQHRQLQEAASRVNGEIQHLGQQFAQKAQQEKQKAQARCIEELRKEYPDFGTELLKSLDETGRSFGFSGEELAGIVDPRVIRVLHAAMQFKKLQGAKTIVAKKVQTAKPVQAAAARSASTSQANAQLKDARDRMRKSGKASDAEGFLAARFARAMR